MGEDSYLSNICDEAIGLLMTYQCNLNCKYCYIHTKKSKAMSLDMAKSIIEPFLLKDQGLLNIAFMGGETLLAIDVIRPLVEWAENSNWRRRFRFFGSTNGTLLSEDLKLWLTEHKESIRLGLSYDGLPSSQVNNRGDDAIDVDFFLDTWPKQAIQMTINRETVPQMADGIIYLLKKGAKVHPNVAFEQTQWGKQDFSEYSKQLNKLIKFYSENDEYPLISQFIHNLGEYAFNLQHPITEFEVCGMGHGFQVYDVDGLSYPCHILSPLVLNEEKANSISEIVSNTPNAIDGRCEGCPYITTCPTCAACNFIYRNDINRRDFTHCNVMRLEVKAFIKKEVARLKKKEVLSQDDALEIDAIKKLVEYNRNHHYLQWE